MKIRKPLQLLSLLLCSILLLALASGCILNTAKSESKPEPAPAENEPAEKVKKPTAIYHDFEDVLVPMELKTVKDRTVVVSTPGFRSGILTLKGRVDSNSLFNFFSNNMEKDNWQVISKIKSPGTTIMVFQKTARCAIITIRDESVYTYVEIGVAPTLSGDSMEKTSSQTY